MIFEFINIIIINILLFIIGLTGIFLNRKNILMVLVSIEIIFLAINLNFVLISIYLDDILGHIFVIFILTIAAAESAIALSLITILNKITNSINIQSIKEKIITKI